MNYAKYGRIPCRRAICRVVLFGGFASITTDGYPNCATGSVSASLDGLCAPASSSVLSWLRACALKRVTALTCSCPARGRMCIPRPIFDRGYAVVNLACCGPGASASRLVVEIRADLSESVCHDGTSHRRDTLLPAKMDWAFELTSCRVSVDRR